MNHFFNYPVIRFFSIFIKVGSPGRGRLIGKEYTLGIEGVISAAYGVV